MTRNRNRNPRLFLPERLTGESVEIRDQRAHYLRHVLRLRQGDALVLFNGLGEERHAIVERLSRGGCWLELGSAADPLPESPLELVLMQAVAKSEAMDLIVQKAAELGVSAIYPVSTDFSVVKLDETRATRRTEHWQKIAASACEQSGRHYPPRVHRPQKLPQALENIPGDEARALLDPGSRESFRDMLEERRHPARLTILIGPEGGFSPTDYEIAEGAGFSSVSLGPRTLRTETAAIAACTLAQWSWGDLDIR